MNITNDIMYKNRGTRRCDNCAFWKTPVNDGGSVIPRWSYDSNSPVGGPIRYLGGHCARYSPKQIDDPKWPITNNHDWCGEFSISKEALEDMAEFNKSKDAAHPHS